MTHFHTGLANQLAATLRARTMDEIAAWAENQATVLSGIGAASGTANRELFEQDVAAFQSLAAVCLKVAGSRDFLLQH